MLNNRPRTVWKYRPTKCHNAFDILILPQGAIIRSAVNIGDELCIYAEVDPTETARCIYHIIALGTGHFAALDGFTFLNTVYYPRCQEVYHVYYRLAAA